MRSIKIESEERRQSVEFGTPKENYRLTICVSRFKKIGMRVKVEMPRIDERNAKKNAILRRSVDRRLVSIAARFKKTYVL